MLLPRAARLILAGLLIQRPASSSDFPDRRAERIFLTDKHDHFRATLPSVENRTDMLSQHDSIRLQPPMLGLRNYEDGRAKSPRTVGK